MTDRLVDPVTVEVVTSGLAAGAREMGITLRQTSSSTIFNEGNDYSCAIFNPGGELVSHGEFLPIHLGSLPYSVAYAIDEVGVENFRAGDSIILNEPFRGGSHLPDVTLVSPIFFSGEIVGWGANRVTWTPFWLSVSGR